MLNVVGLEKSFGDHRVLHGVDLTVPAGTITVVVGESGCGKTTLLRLVAGFEIPDAGTISIADSTVSAPGICIAPHRRGVGYVAQDGALFPHLTVGQNIAYGLRGNARQTRSRVVELLATVSLDESYAHRRPDELSGGQQQRVALARALARRPALMLLDEPFSALDSGLRASTRRAVTALLAEAGVTTLLVTHDQQEALSVADQVAVMRDGRFTKVGTPQEVYHLPSDLFTAEFLGDCVLLPGEVSGNTAECVLGRLPVRGAVVAGTATLMLRPEQLTAVSVTDGAAHGFGRQATVLASEFRGHDVILTVALGNGQAPITVRQHSICPPAVGASILIEVSGSAMAFPGQREPFRP